MGLREESKGNWTRRGAIATEGELKLGCMQRIADATEVMAQSFVQLQIDRDLYKRWYEDARDSNRRMERTISALRGVITRMKRKKVKRRRE